MPVPTEAVSNPTLLIMIAGLVLGFAGGIIMHRSDYCVAGMFRDIFMFKNTFMLRTLLILVSVSMALFEIGRRSGALIHPFPILGPPSLASFIGGVLFGVGMVLAGGCVVGTLYKMGSGSLVSLVAFAGLIIGSGLYAEFHSLWGPFIKATTFFTGKITIPQIVGTDPAVFVVPFIMVSSFFIYKWFKAGGLERRSFVDGYIQPWKAALLLAAAGFLSYVFAGMPMGITTSYSKIAAMLEEIFAPEHVAGLAYMKAVSLNFTHPLTGEVMKGGPGPVFDAIAVIQMPVIVGIVLGSAFSAISLREFRIYTNVPQRQFIAALAGGVIMGLASRMTPGCNIWHLFGGLPILAVQSILFFAGLLPGAWLGSKMFTGMVVKTGA
ncbi:MAG: YeeE/YedE family protein [Nitrospirae bacterium]|nr:MAG: YeeE/YedE family protein [Nitrospirota bacterium]